MENLEKKLEETKRERDGYLAFERDVKKKREAILAAGEEGDGEEKRLEVRITKVCFFPLLLGVGWG